MLKNQEIFFANFLLCMQQMKRVMHMIFFHFVVTAICGCSTVFREVHNVCISNQFTMNILLLFKFPRASIMSAKSFKLLVNKIMWKNKQKRMILWWLDVIVSYFGNKVLLSNKNLKTDFLRHTFVKNGSNWVAFCEIFS